MTSKTKRSFLQLGGLTAVAIAAGLVGCGKKEEPAKPADPYVLGYTMKDIDGKDQKLDQYKGKVIMVVNVASA